MVDAGNGGVSDNKTLHYTGSNPVLTTCFGGRLLLIHRNLHKTRRKIKEMIISSAPS